MTRQILVAAPIFKGKNMNTPWLAVGGVVVLIVVISYIVGRGIAAGFVHGLVGWIIRKSREEKADVEN